MTREEALTLAQTRANTYQHTVLVITIYGQTDWRTGAPEYHVTIDRDDLPDEWAIYAVVTPEQVTR